MILARSSVFLRSILPVGAALFAGVCSGQPVTPANDPGTDRLARTPETRGLRPVVELAAEPVRLESVALTFYPPQNCRVQSTSVGGSATIEIVPENIAADAAWYLVIKSPRTSNEDLTAAQVADGYLIELIAANGLVFDAGKGMKGPQIKEMWERNEITSVGNFLGFQGLVQSRHRDVEIPGFPDKAEQYFVSLPSGTGESPMIRGMTVVKTAPGQFVTFELFTQQSYFDRARDLYTVLLHAATIGDPAEIAESRSSAVMAGLALMDRLSPGDFEEIVRSAGERWERRFKAASTRHAADAEELGYRRIKVWKGRRGELNPKASPGRYNATEMQEGYLVRIDARLIEKKELIDSQSIFFVTADREEEDWSVSLKVQAMNRTNVRTFTETGTRRGRSLTVSVGGTGNPGITSKPVIESAGYISRVDSYLLPQILVKTRLTGDFGFYCFQSDTGHIRLRRDRVSEPPETPDTWILETRLSEDGKTQTSTYTSEGRLVVSLLPDGTVWEPIEFDRLVRMWRSKGLPMD